MYISAKKSAWNRLDIGLGLELELGARSGVGKRLDLMTRSRLRESRTQ